MKRVLGIGLILVASSAARAEAPRPEDLMAGAPPPGDRQVTQANWMTWPYTTWSFQHLESILPATTMDRGASAVRDPSPDRHRRGRRLIHGQVIAISPQRKVAMVVQSSHPRADGAFFGVTLTYFEHLARHLTQQSPR